MSPLLWCIVIDHLLLKLNAVGYTTQAYAGDLVIVIRGKYLSTFLDLMQGSLRVVDDWCKIEGLSINKTDVALFTRDRKSDGIVRLEFQGVNLNLAKKVKYLSVIVNDRLMWKAPLKTWVLHKS